MSLLGEGEPRRASREQAVRAALADAYHGQLKVRMTTSEPTATGVALSERFVNHLELLRLVDSPPLTERQVAIMRAYYRDDRNDREIGAELYLSARTVSRERRNAVETMIRVLWGEPEYHSPSRSLAENVTHSDA